jgi:hypothetical protein
MIVAQNKTETQIEVPIDSPIVPKPNLPPSPYDYFALLPALITAVTPLILGLKQKPSDRDDNDRNSGKKKLTLPEKDNDDAPNLEKKLSEKDGDDPIS